MPRLRDLGAAWSGRPRGCRRSVWALILALDRLPWPWGEEILAHCFVANTFVRTERRRRTLAWAATHSGHGEGRWRLARSLCAHHGRFMARAALIGIRDAAAFHRLVEVRGVEHLAAAPPGRLLVNFHVGPPLSYLALRIAGHDATWIGEGDTRAAWPHEIRDRFESRRELLLFRPDRHIWVKRLYLARQLLARGQDVFMTADGPRADAFPVPLPGGPMLIGEGWLSLRRATGVAVFPVLSHFEGRRHIVTIHPPLPGPIEDRAVDRDMCRDSLSKLLRHYVQQFPEQCCSLTFPLRARFPGDRA